MTALQNILDAYRNAAVSEREKGTYFEELTICYLRNEATYKDLYSDVWRYAEWAELQGLAKRDTGIDLVAKTRGTDEFHAIQCKLYGEDHTIQKSDIDSFFTASGKKYFTTASSSAPRTSGASPPKTPSATNSLRSTKSTCTTLKTVKSTGRNTNPRPSRS